MVIAYHTTKSMCVDRVRQRKREARLVSSDFKPTSESYTYHTVKQTEQAPRGEPYRGRASEFTVAALVE